MARNEKEEDEALMTNTLMLTCYWLAKWLELEDAGKDEKEKNDNYPL